MRTALKRVDSCFILQLNISNDFGFMTSYKVHLNLIRKTRKLDYGSYFTPLSWYTFLKYCPHSMYDRPKKSSDVGLTNEAYNVARFFLAIVLPNL